MVKNHNEDEYINSFNGSVDENGKTTLYKLVV